MSAIINILIAEDEKNIAFLLKTIISSKLPNAQVTVVSNGREALDATLEISFQLIISDLNMPVMTGLELLNNLRENNSTMTIPFVLITGEDKILQQKAIFENGVTEYIAKPFENKHFINKVKELLKF